MGSRCSISLYAPTEEQAANAASSAFDKIARIEQVLTDYHPKSESMLVTKMSPLQWHRISLTLSEVLLESQSYFERTQGSFDPTIGVFTHLWRSAKNQARIPTESELRSASGSAGFSHLQLSDSGDQIRFDTTGIVLDFGGIGKGYAADKAVDLLNELGYPVSMVNLGGDMSLGDAPPDHPQGWMIEIQTGMSIEKTVALSNCGIATSGDLERFFEYDGVRYSHIVDPRTGMGITEQRAATVIAPNATIADALASASLVLGTQYVDELEAAFPGITIELQFHE